MTMKDRHVLQSVLRSSYRMQARVDGIAFAKKKAKKLSPEEREAYNVEERADKLAKRHNLSPEEAEETVTEVVRTKEMPDDAAPAKPEITEPVPVAKGVKGPLGNLVNGQRFFVPGAVGDFILEGWKYAPGTFDKDDNPIAQHNPVVRRITQRRTATKAEAVLKAVAMTMWFKETICEVIDDFSLQVAPEGVSSKNSPNKDGGDEMANKKSKTAKKSNGEAKTSKRAEFAAKTIKVLAAENPKRKGSDSAKRFALYKTGMTVGAFVEKGGTLGDVHYDVAHKHISVS